MKYPENIEEIEKFAEEIGIDEKYLLGKKYEGYLRLPFVESLPANIKFNVGGYLNLYSVKSLPDNIVFNVGKGIHLPTKHKVKVIWS